MVFMLLQYFPILRTGSKFTTIGIDSISAAIDLVITTLLEINGEGKIISIHQKVSNK
jgi:hypothetical protein